MEGYNRVLGAALVVALIAAAPAAYGLTALSQETTTTTPAATTTQAPSAPAANAVMLYVKKVSVFINKTLEVAGQRNITIPENLTPKVEAAKGLVAQAEAELEAGNVTGALTLATMASKEFLGVAVYVYSSTVPEGEKIREQEKLIVEINARIASLEMAKRMVERLAEAGVNVTALNETITEVNETLNKALEYARQGNITAAQVLLKKAEEQLEFAVKATYKMENDRLKEVAAATAALRGLSTALDRVADRLNETVELIQEGKLKIAIAHLSGVQSELSGLNNALVKIQEAVSRKDVNSTYLSLIDSLINATNTSITYIEESITALKTGDSNTSITYIAMAVNELSSSLSGIDEKVMPLLLKKELKIVMDLSEKVKFKFAKGPSKDVMYSVVSMQVDREKAKLQGLLDEYNAGRISKSRLVSEAAKTYDLMVKIEKSLEGKAPDWLIQKIDGLLNWIKTNIPEAAGGDHGGPRK